MSEHDTLDPETSEKVDIVVRDYFQQLAADVDMAEVRKLVDEWPVEEPDE